MFLHQSRAATIMEKYGLDGLVATTRRRGIRHYQRHHLGHGNGLEGYEHPLVSPGSSMKLEPGMVICIESPYYEPGFGGIQIEDIVKITEDGYRRLTQIERKLFVI